MSPLIFSDIGLVGEVYIGAHAEALPLVIEATDPLQWSTESSGMLRRSSTRPMLRLQWEDAWWPLMINTYTGGLADWLGRIWTFCGGTAEMGRWLYAFWGGLSCILLFLSCQKPLGIRLAFWLALNVALCWDLMLYRTALAGTEQLLQMVWGLAIVTLLFSKKSRSWAVLIFLGIHAKITFILSALPLFGALLCQKKTSALRWALLGLGIGIVPVLALASGGAIPSHDSIQLQGERILKAFQGQDTASRETWHNMWIWLSNPPQFWAEHYKLGAGPFPYLRNIALAGLGLLTLAGWRRSSPFQSPLHWSAAICLVQAILLAWLAKDSHHFSLLSISLIVWMTCLVAHSQAQKASSLRAPAMFLLLLWPLSSIRLLAQSPAQWEPLSYHGLSEKKQRELCTALLLEEPKLVLTLDYDIYGVFESRCPDLPVAHAWGAIAQRRQSALPESVKALQPSHILVFSDSPPWIYNLRPNSAQLADLLPELEIEAHMVLDTATLYALKERL